MQLIAQFPKPTATFKMNENVWQFEPDESP